MIRLAIVLVVLVGLGFLGWQLTRPPEEVDFEAQIIDAGELELPNFGFETVSADYDFSIPEDVHPQFQRERWTFTLTDCEIDSAMFERTTLLPNAPTRASDWALQGVLLAQVAQDDAILNRFSRTAQGLAGAEAGRVWVEAWELRWDASGFTLDLRDTFSGDFTFDDPVTDIQDGHYSLRYDLAGACEGTLVHQFGESLP